MIYYKADIFQGNEQFINNDINAGVNHSSYTLSEYKDTLQADTEDELIEQIKTRFNNVKHDVENIYSNEQIIGGETPLKITTFIHIFLVSETKTKLRGL